MEKNDLLQYLDFARNHGFVLEITGVSNKKSKVIIDSYNDYKLFGRFSHTNENMSYRYANIVSCRFAAEAEQQRFEKALCMKAYGDQAQNLEQHFTHYKKYYQQIILSRNGDVSEGETDYESSSLPQQAAERFETVFHQTLIKPESLLFHYFLGQPVNTTQKADETPILLLSRSNYSQKQAVEKALKDRISVIEGPPGTGKTTTILSIIANLVIRGKRFAVVSKNNSAIENIQEELDRLQLPPFYIRLGNKNIMDSVNRGLKALVHETIEHAHQLPEEKSGGQDLYRLYTQLKAMETEINRLMEKKNQLQEDENMLRHMNKRKAALQEEYEFRGRSRFQNRSLESMRREIDSIAYSLQQLDYKGRYSVWNWLKNSFIWHLNRDEFESEGLLLQFQLEYLYLVRETEELAKELRNAQLEEKQKKLGKLYDEQYITSSHQYLKNFLRQFSQRPAYQESVKHILNCNSVKPYSDCKNDVREMYPVILTTADALVYNFSDLIKNGNKLDYIIIDEASQCDLITGIPVLYLADRCVVVGDQKQLSAITSETPEQLPKVREAYDYFKENLLSSVQKAWNLEPTLLREHYRCDYAIINYCNKFYYNGELIIYTEATPDAMQMLTVEQGKYAQMTEQGSFCNEREIKAIESVAGFTLDKSYVITPFKGQGERLRKHFQCNQNVCGTIHTFQGRGQETVFFSTVLNDLPFANSHLAGSHCLFGKELLNVAVSRAKKRFVLVSDTSYLREKNVEMRNLIDYIGSYGHQIPEKTVCLFDGLYRKMRAYTRHDNLDNIFEEKLYQSIAAYCSKHPQIYCRIKLPLADLVRDKAYLDQNPGLRNFVLHHNTHVDFTLCNAIDNPILAIELDGQHHQNPEQQARDAKKDAALQHMQIPMWRLSSKAALTEADFEQKVDMLLGYQAP